MNPCRGLDDYFPFLFPDGLGAALILGGYFDESERTDGAEPICVGGYLFKEAGYKKFRHKWSRDVLGNGKFADFHMTDLCAGQKEYAGISIQERVAVLDHAISAIGKHSYAGIGVYFDRREFAKVAPHEWPMRRGSIYTAACGMCLQATAFWLKKWGCRCEVLYVFERGHKFQAEVNKVLTAIGKDADARSDFLYRNHMFEPKSEFGLQAADLLAWTMTKANACAGNVPPAMRPFVPAILRLGSANSNSNRQMIYPFTGARLKGFIDQQMGATKGIEVDFGPRRRTLK